MSNVTFEPGCRNNWHIHNSKFPVGQVLICVDGDGWYQKFGKEAVNYIPIWWKKSQITPNTGTEPQKTPGFLTLLFQSRMQQHQQNGARKLVTMNITLY